MPTARIENKSEILPLHQLADRCENVAKNLHEPKKGIYYTADRTLHSGVAPVEPLILLIFILPSTSTAAINCLTCIHIIRKPEYQALGKEGDQKSLSFLCKDKQCAFMCSKKLKKGTSARNRSNFYIVHARTSSVCVVLCHTQCYTVFVSRDCILHNTY